MSRKQRQKEKRKSIQMRKHNRRQSIEEKGLETLKRKMQSDPPFGNRQVVFEENLGTKMSETLLEFVEPYQEYAKTRDAFERLIAVASVAWNAALFPHESRATLLDETSKMIEESAGGEGAEVYRALVNDLIKRKERYFADNKRLIVRCQVTEDTENKGRFHLAVASMV